MSAKWCAFENESWRVQDCFIVSFWELGHKTFLVGSDLPLILSEFCMAGGQNRCFPLYLGFVALHEFRETQEKTYVLKLQ